MSGEQKKQREILIENKSKEEKDPTYQEQRVEWNVRLKDRLIAEWRLKNPSKRLSRQVMRKKSGKTNSDSPIY